MMIVQILRRKSSNLANFAYSRRWFTTSTSSVFSSQSYRRVDGSPSLPLEAVEIPEAVQQEVQRIATEKGLSAKFIRKHAKAFQSVRAPETLRQKNVVLRGHPIVQRVAEYTPEESVSFAVTRFPGTLTSNTHVMAEIHRQLPHFRPKSLLDFGSGCGSSTMAASTVFWNSSHVKWGPKSKTNPLEKNAPQLTQMNHSNSGSEDDDSRQIKLIERSSSMRNIASRLLKAHPSTASNEDLSITSSLSDLSQSQLYDLVCASYSLSEIARETLIDPSSSEEDFVSRKSRESLTDHRVRKFTRSLWRKTSPGGIFVLIEDGTAAGFEMVAVARDEILKSYNNTKPNDVTEDDEPNMQCTQSEFAQVVAPCLHSGQCPLGESINRHRVCRFVQRLNRPFFLRAAQPLPTGFEDEFFSYVAIQKLNHELKSETEGIPKWGRLIRNPLFKGKHVTLDACTSGGELERRVVTKKNSSSKDYSRARHSKWGDIWATTPTSKAQKVNF